MTVPAPVFWITSGVEGATYADRLKREILPESITQVALNMARTDYPRVAKLFKSDISR